jgi:hypothetical protein
LPVKTFREGSESGMGSGTVKLIRWVPSIMTEKDFRFLSSRSPQAVKACR